MRFSEDKKFICAGPAFPGRATAFTFLTPQFPYIRGFPKTNRVLGKAHTTYFKQKIHREVEEVEKGRENRGLPRNLFDCEPLVRFDLVVTISSNIR
jgi:hypothetical protein